MIEGLKGLDSEDQVVGVRLLTDSVRDDPGRLGDPRDLDVPLADPLFVLRPAGEVGHLSVGERADGQSVNVLLPTVEVAGLVSDLSLAAQVKVVPGDHGLGVAGDVTDKFGPHTFSGVDPVAGRGHLGGICSDVINSFRYNGHQLPTVNFCIL